MQIKVNRIAPLVAAGAAAVAIAAAPSAAATTLATGSTVIQNPGNAEITAEPGAAASHAAPAAATIRRGYGRPDIPPWRPWGPLENNRALRAGGFNRALSEVVPGLLELEVAAPRNRPG